MEKVPYRVLHEFWLLAFYQWLFRYMHAQLGLHTVIGAHVAFSLAYVVVVVIARLRTLDPALEEAAMDLGANEWTTFRRVTFPTTRKSSRIVTPR